MPIAFTSLRVLACLTAGVLMALCSTAQAQQQGVFPYRWNEAPPADAITPADIREALMWTGHLQASFKGELSAAVLEATQAWQKSKNHKPTDKLTDEQTKDLIQQGLKERDEVGWSIFRDPAVGFAIGIPAKLVTFGTPRMENTSLLYPGTGSVQEVIGVSHGYPNCRNIDGVYARVKTGATHSLKKGNWFVALFRGADYSTYYKMTCYSTGSIWTEINVANDTLQKHPGLFSMMAHSVVLLRNPDPTVRPRPRVDDLPAASSGFSDEQVARPQAKSKPAKTPTATIDESGKTNSVKLETRDGPDLRAEEVFDKAAGAVYVVKADRRLGSAVAISDSELLTNCHVTGDLAEVKIARAKDEQSAKVVSRAAEADRCVLRVTTKLPSWVTVRPYDDIKVGERAITIGTPQGLELTAAEGIVSSKRTYNQSRVIQTSAPISQGSSGGGLFDARGHLLGITTFYVKAGQNLNFAVAAEEFAQDSEEQANR